MIIKLFSIFIFLFVTFLTNGQSRLALAREKSSSNFIESSLEYERILYEEANYPTIDTAIFEKTLLLKNNNLLVEADIFIEKNIGLVQDSSLSYKLHSEWLLILYLKNSFDKVSSLSDEIDLFYKNRLNSNWLSLVRMLIYSEKKEWGKTDSIFNKLKSANKFTDTFGITEKLRISPKLLNESKATLLSYIIPGGGQFYAKKPLEGITNMALQLLCLTYAIVCFNSGLYLNSWLIGGGLFGSFKFGGQRRSEALVKEYNTKIAAIYNQELRAKLINMYKQLNK